MKVLHLSEEEATELFVELTKRYDQTMPLSYQFRNNKILKIFLSQIISTFDLVWRDDKKKFMKL